MVGLALYVLVPPYFFLEVPFLFTYHTSMDIKVIMGVGVIGVGVPPLFSYLLL